ncbi:3-deoxy-manno-octulosonate cytidylyltransferase [Marinobacter zhejiangensis]|uniref:3-deoxy-manno-octulosonate cytidylyltransferase n=1 Tax=Marinobacter zhejiangensis TaxID=488535 RepID=A0A1I4RJV4_9GAMM|nr:3-deoxy-manno-octulosonate cytidylyltransferase [Marinobacter zhejiangensis]SFM52200.1 3-deoxy-manno-octulosonate cytidylyltransferase (CMP-KDO synthetase) [Marinobacter zhejiangensis]
MSFTVVIPARYSSSRLPGKPLADIAGKPMIQHVYERATESKADRVVIATDDQRIMDACKSFGAEAVMTSADHASGTDRLEEVARTLGFSADHRVINVQGDEPMIPPALINQVAANLGSNPEASISTLCEQIDDVASLFNPNVVKVVFDHRGMAHYFSRAPIPWARDAWSEGQRPDSLPEGASYYRHIGIYGYRVGLLTDFVTWSPAPIETTECLEQLRALFNGARIHVAEACQAPPAGVDTEEDLTRLRRLMADTANS